MEASARGTQIAGQANHKKKTRNSRLRIYFLKEMKERQVKTRYGGVGLYF
jgi:hypothetical protein